jgi:hypothetical protein
MLLRPVKLTFLRGMFDADTLVQTAVDYYNEMHQDTNNSSRYHVYHVHGTAGKPPQIRMDSPRGRPIEARSSDGRDEYLGLRLLKWKISDLGPNRHSKGKAFDDIAMNQEMQALWDRLQRWYKNREWFVSRSLSWNYKTLLHGPPGTGKTMFVRTVAEDLDLPVFSFDLSTFCNDELRDAWMDVQASEPAVILIEDIDGVFHGREPANDKIQLTFDALLNCIDGVERTNGLLVFVTTNKIETLDQALGGLRDSSGNLSRPGRIDCSVLCSQLDPAGCRKIATRILKDWPEAIERAVHDGKNLTGAQFERRCTDMAEQLYWKTDEPGPLLLPLSKESAYVNSVYRGL